MYIGISLPSFFPEAEKRPCVFKSETDIIKNGITSTEEKS